MLENNTYHDQGILAVIENYDESFCETNIGLAYHDLKPRRVAISA